MDNKTNNDCQDQYFECASECSTDDQECHDECIEDLKECDVPRPEEEIADAFNTPDKGDLIAELITIASLLGGTMERYQTLNSTGKSSKVIQIEYDVKYKNTT